MLDVAPLVEDASDVGASIFIASSSSGAGLAESLQAALHSFCEPDVWSQSLFEPTSETLGSLLGMVRRNDFAAFVMTPDDIVEKRDKRLERCPCHRVY